MKPLVGDGDLAADAATTPEKIRCGLEHDDFS
jgi:hypothetical protein